jgi:hypothetical protein
MVPPPSTLMLVGGAQYIDAQGLRRLPVLDADPVTHDPRNRSMAIHSVCNAVGVIDMAEACSGAVNCRVGTALTEFQLRAAPRRSAPYIPGMFPVGQKVHVFTTPETEKAPFQPPAGSEFGRDLAGDFAQTSCLKGGIWPETSPRLLAWNSSARLAKTWFKFALCTNGIS